MDFQLRRERMVEEQLVRRGIRDPRVLDAFRRIPRHHFVEEALREKAYGDFALPIGYGQTISQPYIVALMTELLRLRPEHRVLEIGTGSGFQSAILSCLAAQVYSIERIPQLAQRAQATLQDLGIRNVHVKVFDGTYGWSEWAPFHGVLVAAAAPEVPPPLIDQMGEGGRLIAPVGGEDVQVLRLLVREASGRVRAEEHGGCVFVKLLGRFGWPGPEATAGPGET
ncbi:MAG: protein-L-isoaspartate(D-aspartate) O-methyltransferase [Acidobacteria bacterium]|nr:protein-L-isoaspartate(D-aspartate) O-methyltransferase [Acidobacteriota bacterium]